MSTKSSSNTNKYNRFNFSPETIQGRFRISFITTIGLMLLLLGISYFGLSSLLSRENHINTSVGAVKYYSSALASAVNRSYAEVVSYSVYQQPYYRNAALTIMNNEIKFSCESLVKAGEAMHDVHTTDLIMEVKDHYLKLKDSYNMLGGNMSPAELETHVKTRISPLVSKMNEEIKNLSVVQLKKEDMMNRSQTTELKTLRFVLGVLLLTMLLLSYFIVGRIIKATLKGVDALGEYTRTLSEGELPELHTPAKDELEATWKNLNALVENLRKVKLFAMQVGDGNFDNNIIVFNNSGVLGTELAEMRYSLKRISQQEKIRDWLSTGTASMAQIIRENNDDVQSLCDNLLASMVDYTGSNQGAIFILNEENVLELTASYAYGRKKFITKEVEIGHGLLGEAFRDGDTRVITDIPKTYMEIRSGLGKGAPTCIAIIPVKSQTEILGILEIASFENYEPHHISFFETVAGILASSVTTIINNEKNKRLLEDAREYSMRMNAQEEVLRQHAEELMATREDVERKYHDLEQEAVLMKSALKHAASAIIHTDTTGAILYVNDAAGALFGYRKEDLVQRNLFKMISTLRSDIEDLLISDEGQLSNHHVASVRGNMQVHVQAGIRRFMSEGKMLFSVSLLKSELQPVVR